MHAPRSPPASAAAGQGRHQRQRHPTARLAAAACLVVAAWAAHVHSAWAQPSPAPALSPELDAALRDGCSTILQAGVYRLLYTQNAPPQRYDTFIQAVCSLQFDPTTNELLLPASPADALPVTTTSSSSSTTPGDDGLSARPVLNNALGGGSGSGSSLEDLGLVDWYAAQQQQLQRQQGPTPRQNFDTAAGVLVPWYADRAAAATAAGGGVVDPIAYGIVRAYHAAVCLNLQPAALDRLLSQLGTSPLFFSSSLSSLQGLASGYAECSRAAQQGLRYSRVSDALDARPLLLALVFDPASASAGGGQAVEAAYTMAPPTAPSGVTCLLSLSGSSDAAGQPVAVPWSDYPLQPGVRYELACSPPAAGDGQVSELWMSVKVTPAAGAGGPQAAQPRLYYALLFSGRAEPPPPSPPPAPRPPPKPPSPPGPRAPGGPTCAASLPDACSQLDAQLYALQEAVGAELRPAQRATADRVDNLSGAVSGLSSRMDALLQLNGLDADGQDLVSLASSLRTALSSIAALKADIEALKKATGLVGCRVWRGSGARTLTAGDAHTCVLLEDASVRCWGYAADGRLGLGDESNDIGDEAREMGSALPAVALPARKAVASIEAGCYHTCALLAPPFEFEDGGPIKCWGDNVYGQLGVGGGDTDVGVSSRQMGSRLKPIDLGLDGAKALTLEAGCYHTCALLDSGAIKCWGDNGYGQLGVPQYKDEVWYAKYPAARVMPAVELGPGARAVGAVAGFFHTCGLLDSGEVKCWGDNGYGQLGLGDTQGPLNDARGNDPGEMGAALPAIDLGPGVWAIGVAAGGFHTCAVSEAGRVKCWGGNAYGQLGLGDTLDRGSRPGQMGANLPYVDLGTSARATAVACGHWHTCALTEEGAVRCWGANGSGQLGLGHNFTIGDEPGEMGRQLAPVDLGGSGASGLRAVAIAAGGAHTCAQLSDGGVKCWGDNTHGQLGQGDDRARGAAAGTMGDALREVDLGKGNDVMDPPGGGPACASSP